MKRVKTEGQPGNKLPNFRWPHLQRVAHPVVAQEIAYPVPVGLLGASAVVIHPNNIKKLFSQACLVYIAFMRYFWLHKKKKSSEYRLYAMATR